ncbi:MAG: hypothetical protein ABR586_06915 [Thermoplasmatota archaeon]
MPDLSPLEETLLAILVALVGGAIAFLGSWLYRRRFNPARLKVVNHRLYAMREGRGIVFLPEVDAASASAHACALGTRQFFRILHIGKRSLWEGVDLDVGPERERRASVSLPSDGTFERLSFRVDYGNPTAAASLAGILLFLTTADGRRYRITWEFPPLELDDIMRYLAEPEGRELFMLARFTCMEDPGLPGSLQGPWTPSEPL